MGEEETPSENLVSIWKTSHRGRGERHLEQGYPAGDFPGEGEDHPDGCAYFARDRWIAEEFASKDLLQYEDWIIEVRIPVETYQHVFAAFERPFHSTKGAGIEVRIPAESLKELNLTSQRVRHDAVLNP